MKKLLLYSVIFISVSVCLIFIIILRIDGHDDEFYPLLTSEQQSSMIIGTSRAAQGIMPEIIQKELKEYTIYNFAFTIVHSPFGPTYLRAIKKKLKQDYSGNRIFIISVDPWAISAGKQYPDSVDLYTEKNLCLGIVENINTKINLEYLYKCYPKQFFTAIYNRDTNLYRHDDGWLEVSVDMSESEQTDRTVEKVGQYKQNAKNYTFSKTRYNYLDSTIIYLHNIGNVYLVRLPVSEGIYNIEQNYMPEFNNYISKLTQNHNLHYFDFTVANNQYVYTDGNHMYKSSSRLVSKQIADSITMVVQ